MSDTPTGFGAWLAHTFGDTSPRTGPWTHTLAGDDGVEPGEADDDETAEFEGWSVYRFASADGSVLTIEAKPDEVVDRGPFLYEGQRIDSLRFGS